MVNEFEKLDKMAEEREAICRACPLCKEVNTMIICNPNLYLNLEDGKTTSDVPIAGYKRGCGCMMTKRWSNPNSKCVCGKW